MISSLKRCRTTGGESPKYVTWHHLTTTCTPLEWSHILTQEMSSGSQLIFKWCASDIFWGLSTRSTISLEWLYQTTHLNMNWLPLDISWVMIKEMSYYGWTIPQNMSLAHHLTTTCTPLEYQLTTTWHLLSSDMRPHKWSTSGTQVVCKRHILGIVHP